VSTRGNLYRRVQPALLSAARRPPGQAVDQLDCGSPAPRREGRPPFRGRLPGRFTGHGCAWRITPP